MLINLRNALMSGKRTPTAKDYVQDGLVAMWDGIENAGWGTHDDTTTTWKDLAGNRDLTYTQGTIINPDNAQCTSYSSSIAYRSGNIPAVTMEFVFKLDDAQTSASCFVLLNRQNTVRYNGQFGFNYGYFGNLYFETLGNIRRCGVPFDITDRTIHSISAAWGNGNYSPATSGNVDGVSRLVTNLAGTGRDGDANFIVGGLAPFQPYAYGMKGRVYSVRFYSRALTAGEIARNYNIDKARFGLP